MGRTRIQWRRIFLFVIVVQLGFVGDAHARCNLGVNLGFGNQIAIQDQNSLLDNGQVFINGFNGGNDFNGLGGFNGQNGFNQLGINGLGQNGFNGLGGFNGQNGFNQLGINGLGQNGLNGFGGFNGQGQNGFNGFGGLGQNGLGGFGGFNGQNGFGGFDGGGVLLSDTSGNPVVIGSDGFGNILDPVTQSRFSIPRDSQGNALDRFGNLLRVGVQGGTPILMSFDRRTGVLVRIPSRGGIPIRVSVMGSGNGVGQQSQFGADTISEIGNGSGDPGAGATSFRPHSQVSADGPATHSGGDSGAVQRRLLEEVPEF